MNIVLTVSVVVAYCAIIWVFGWFVDVVDNLSATTWRGAIKEMARGVLDWWRRRRDFARAWVHKLKG